MSQPVEALLAVAAYPEDGVAFMSFEFWQRLSAVLTRTGSKRAEGGGGVVEVSSAEAARRRAFFQPAFVRLIQSIQHRVKYPVNFEDWSKSQKADFRRARYAVADTLGVAAQLVGAETCLGLLVKPLATLSDQVRATGQHGPAGDTVLGAVVEDVSRSRRDAWAWTGRWRRGVRSSGATRRRRCTASAPCARWRPHRQTRCWRGYWPCYPRCPRTHR